MSKTDSAGKKLRNELKNNKPLQIVGTINPYCALMAESIGHKAIYLSGAGVANASYGLPDLAITTLNDVLEDVRKITSASTLPLLVDIDTGWGGELNIQRTIKDMIRAGASGVHIEDQKNQKRCGHRPNKQLTTTEDMVNRIKAAVDARTDDDFLIMARTDAYSNLGLDEAIDRSMKYIEAGADAIFPEALEELKDYKAFSNSLNVPILANITEFGKTPMFNINELKSVDVSMVLYPLSAFRAMNKAALNVYKTILLNGDQKDVIKDMQTREELYEFLRYHEFENILDRNFENNINF